MAYIALFLIESAFIAGIAIFFFRKAWIPLLISIPALLIFNLIVYCQW
jgi:hypothetical protein